MTDNVSRYPLTWPSGWTRTPAHQRRAAAFSKKVDTAGYNGSTYKRTERLSVGDGLTRLMGELSRLGARSVVVSSNLRLRTDGLPYAAQAKQLDDPGVAVYFTLKGAPRALACDKWTSAAENMAAIAGHIAAVRMQDRYGVGTLEQAFAGYAALPPAAAEWWLVLDVPRDADRDQVDRAFKVKARLAHPDTGGSHDAMATVNAAREAAYEAFRAQGVA